MKCPQCGNSELQEHDRFCCECGYCLDGKPSCERKFKCPQCGNSNIQQHHRFCCECGFCLAGKPSSTATTLLQTSSQQTTSQLKSTPTDGQVTPGGDEWKKEFEEASEVIAPDKDNAKLVAPEEIHLKDHDRKACSETAMATFPDPSTIPASELDDRSTENVIKQKFPAEGILPIETSQISKEPQTVVEGPEKPVQLHEEQDTQLQASKAFPREGLSCSKVHDTSASGGINTSAALVALQNEEKTTSRIPDAVQHHEESDDVKQRSVEKNGADKHGGDRNDTNDERHDHHGKAAEIVGDEKGIKTALEITQDSAVGDCVHGKNLTPPTNDDKGVETPEDGSKRSIRIGNDLESNPVDLKDTARMKDDKKDGSQSSERGTSGTVVSKNSEQRKESLNDSSNDQANNLLSDKEKPASKPKEGGEVTENETSTESAETKDHKPMVQNDDNNKVSLAVQPNETAQDTAKKPDPSLNGKAAGLSSDEGCVTVIFHALLTPTFNIKQGDKVFLRGGPPFSWRRPGKQLEMRVVREVSNGYFILEGETKLTLREASRTINYKYVIARSKGKDHWECLIGFKPVVSGHVNRCLNIPELYIKDNATWHQYDDAVFNEPGLWESFLSLWEDVTQVPADGRRLAMLAMLPEWDTISSAEEGMSAHAALTKINRVVHCMSKAEFENGGYYFPRIPPGFNAMKVLYDYLCPRLSLNVQILQTEAENKYSNTKRLITSVVIASVAALHNVSFLRDDQLKDLLECLFLNGDPERERCSGFDAILAHFPKMEHLSKLANSLLQICDYVINNRPGIFHWLFAIPLLHFLSSSAQPFSASVLPSAPGSVKDDSWWGAQGIKFQSIRRQVNSFSTSTPAHLFLQFSPMFEVDPLFKRTFLLALPICDIAKILQRKIFSLHEVCWTLTRVVEERDAPYLSDEEWASLEHCINEMCDDIKDFNRMDEFKYEEMISLAQAALHLLNHLLAAHAEVIQKRILVLSGIFQLLAKSLLCVKRTSFLDESALKPFIETQNCTDIFQGAFESLRVCLETQFNRNSFYASEELRQDEFQVWSTLLSVMIEDGEFQLFWERGVRDALKSRIYRIDQARVMELFCELDLSTYHQEIRECFKSATFEAVDHLVEVGIKEEHMASLSSRLESSGTDHWQDSVVRKLFALLLKRCWPKGTDDQEPTQNEKLQHILSWKPMAKYFMYFGGQNQQKANLPENGLDLLVIASSLLKDIGLRLRNAEIDVNTLRIVEKNYDSFLKLYSLLTEVEESAESSEKTVSGQMRLFLDMRIDELNAFEKERDAVGCFVDMCSMVRSVDVALDEIKEKLGRDLSSCHVSEICDQRSLNDEPIVKFFGLSSNNKEMIQSLHRICPSRLFGTIWQTCLQKAAKLSKDDSSPNERLNIDQVHELVWTPSHRRWRDLWERVKSGKISLKEVKDRFGRFQNDHTSLDVEIKTILACLSNEDDTIGAILHRRINQIKQSFKLSECSDAAKTILQFQGAMGLEGDFQVLNDFCGQMDEAFQRRTLDNISDDVLEMGRALEQLTRPKIECLRAVIDCKEYISWLQDEVKGREEVKTLVDLAMMSAGESDIETDRVSFLHTTALGFAPFIFDLNKDMGFSQLMSKCESVWKEIEENETLPKKLEAINSHLEWLRGVKDAHSMSSLKLAQAINKRGVYCVGQQDTMTTTILDSVVNLRLPSANNGNASSKTYSLEQLKELQSKLALISGKRSSGQEDVDKFSKIFQGIIQLGQAYVNLCEIGDVTFLDWNEEYKCGSKMGKDVINDIASQTEKFERHFQACKEHINMHRMKYRELNYFTTKQLHFLRKELAAIKNSASRNFPNLQVYALLEKIVPDIHPSMIKDVFLEAGIVSQDNYYSDKGSDQLSWSDSQEDDYHRAAGEQVEIANKYHILLRSVEMLGYPKAERLTVAALVDGWQSSDNDLVVWCVLNQTHDDRIESLYEEAKRNPVFADIVNEVGASGASQCSEDSEEGNTSSAEDDNDEVVDSRTPEEILLDETKGGTYLSLEEIGIFLYHLADSHGGKCVKRRFPMYLNRGRPNLILARKEHIFPAVLSLYMEDGAQGLPIGDEVLICTSETTSEEVELLWRRALAETEGRLYCLVHGDLLDYDVSHKAVDCLHTLTQDYDNENFGIVVLCSSENEERSHLVAALEEYRVTGITRHPKPEELRRYLANQFKAPHQRSGSYSDHLVIWSPAADVDCAGNLNVRVVASKDPGVGKSLFVQRLAEQVAKLPNNVLITERMKEQNQEPPSLCVTIPLHDKHASVADVVGFFLPHAIQSDVPLSRIFHLDSSCTVTPDLDTLLFDLLILGELTDDSGRVWRRNPYDLYIIEITNASSQNQAKTPTSCRFLELLPLTTCLRPRQTIKHLREKAQQEGPLFDEEEFKSEAVQRVWQYLRRFNEDPSQIQKFNFDAERVEGNPKECLKTLIRNCGVRNPSWSEIRYFVNFLNYQLHDCEQSVYCNPVFTEDTLEGFRIFVVTFMIIMSKDFSLRSLKGEDWSSEETPSAHEESDIKPLELRRSWEQSTHPYVFFNPDHETLTFLGFQVDRDGNALLLDPQTGDFVQRKLMTRHLRTGLHVQRVDLNNDFENCSKAEKIEILCKVMGLEWGIDPDESYELTGDNVKKILAIHMRFRCDIPVVIMGETGCGKTRLIRYMCGLHRGFENQRKNLLLMKIHGGTTFKDIERTVLHAEAMAVENGEHNIDTVLFFDEANTTEALGMIKEIMVDRKCNGRPLSSESNRLKFIVACNPYRRHTDEMIQKLESAGLGYHVRADETTERLGRIPLRQLVYRVHVLPESMRSLVWDFGRLQPEVEEKYICQIVRRYVLHERRLPGDEELVIAISEILAVSQQFMGKQKDECSFVSLRDVKRAMEVMVWFYKHYKDFSPLLQNEETNTEDVSESEEEENEEEYERLVSTTLAQKVQYVDEISMLDETHSVPLTEEQMDDSPFTEETLSDDIDSITWSLILALGVCYHARLQKRDEYREVVARAFRHPCRLPGGPDRIEREITRCQQAVMNQLKLGPNIARNTALSENVFMMVVCIELRIPLFVVGKPGSSKSLAKTVVADNMQGDRSPSGLFKILKQIQLISYQCSPQSTPEGIRATFRQCSELQHHKTAETVLDKFASVVVLDEIGLAEDSPKMPLKTLHPLLEDSDKSDDDVIETEDSFSRVAFIGLSNWALDPAKMNRGIMLSRDEPSESELEGTARGIGGDDPDIMPLVERFIRPLVAAYVDLYNKQKTLKRLQDGNKDEFFGLRDFYSLVKMVFHIAKEQKRSPNWEELEHAIKRNFGGLLEEDFNPVNIIKTHLGFPAEFLQNEEDQLGIDCLNLIRECLHRKSIMGEGRYLLILTEHLAALPRVKQLVLEEDNEEPYVIFGSSFPKDQLFTQVCRNINRVKICMETGRTVILLNLENLYESLYDALNQYYVSFGGEKYVDLGIGSHRVKCRVHKDFRLIVIAEKGVVYDKFPIPLINRMEKHFLVMSSGLTESQKHVTKELQVWVEEFAEVFLQPHERKSRKRFTKGDAFVGYHEISVPAIVLQVCSELHEDGSDLSDEKKKKLLKCCQERLLQCATPDSVARLGSSRLSGNADNLWSTYFNEQEHSSLAKFLVKALNDVKSQTTNEAALRAQISTHSRLLSDRDIPMIADAVDLPEDCVKCVSLQQFQTEQQFCNCIGREFFAKLGGRESLLIVQCDSTDQTLNLVACARHLLIEECREMEKELDQKSIGSSHILMIIQLDRVAGGYSGFVGVEGDGWLSVHIDDLCPPSEEVPPIQAMHGRSVSKIFGSALNKTEDNFTVRQVLTSCVQEAASRIEDDETTLKRATRRVELLINLLSPKKSATHESEGSFEMVVAKRLHQLLEQKDQRARNEGNEWLEAEALSSNVQETGTFKKALWRRFQSVVAPVLAEVIAYVDRDGNLELAASEDSWVVNLWLKILQDSSVTYLHYNDFIFQEGDASVVRSKVPVLKSGYHSHSFQCSLPFSWLLKERIDELYRDARSVAANSLEPITECLRRLLNNSEVKAILSEAISEGGEAVVARYLHDFTHMVYNSQDDDELEVVQRAITAAAKEIHYIKTLEERFEMDLAVVHTAYSKIQQRLNWLSLLLQAKPDILPDLFNSFSWDENEMSVDAMALQMCLERMEPQAEDVEETSRRQEWCDAVLSVKIPVEAMIGKASGGKAHMGDKTETILTQCRFMWQRISAVRLFIEHVYPSHADPEDVQTLLKLWKALGDRTDLSKKESLNVVERFLLSCSEDSIQRSQADKPEDHVKFLQRCNAFFMAIVSVFCFGEDTDLDPDVFEMLMRYVVGQELTETKEFSPFPGFGMDSSPVVRSFLLQQLINSSDEKAKKHIERFLYKAQGLSSKVPHVLNVCLLTVQCMENSLASKHAKCSDPGLSRSVSIRISDKLCQDALLILKKDFASSDELPVASLEAIAKARYALDKTSEFMYMSIVSSDEMWTNHETRGALNSLFTRVQALCTSGRSRSPALFLLKQLVKRYGVHSIATISQNEELAWIVPAEFQHRIGDGMTLDRFLVYGDSYRKVRNSLAEAILSEDMDKLIASLESLEDIPNHAKDVILLLALYREVTLPQRTARNQEVQSMVCQMVKDVISRRGKFLSRTARHLASALLENSPEKGVPFLPVGEGQSEIEKALPEVLLHANSVLECIDFDNLLEPLSAIIRTPRRILGSFLPTMPEDSFHETRSAMMKEGGAWYQCPAGHRYFVGDCGRPDQQRNCPDCHGSVAIGGISHHLVTANRLVGKRDDDRSNTGHILGAPQKIIAERDLSPAIVSLMRVILHSAMMGGCRTPEDLRQLIIPEIQADDVCGFLWEHLINDVRNLSTSLGRSEDEVLLAIHFVLSEIVYRATNRPLNPLEYERTSFWSTKEERRNWENEFVDVYVKPIWMNFEERLQGFYAVSVNDRRLGNDPLMREVYEVDAPSPPRTAADIHPEHEAFWKYRTRVTVDLVTRNFQEVKSNKTAHKILGKFLDKEHQLRALRFLPDIVALQRILTDRFHRRIDKEKANQLKIRDFLNDLPRGQKDDASKLFRSFRSAWDLVRHQLSSQGRFAPTKEQCLKSVEKSSTVSLLLPASEGPGVCCKGLLFFLVNTHNELVQAYHNSANTRSTSLVPLSEVSASQLIAYDSEKDLLPVMLANCTYSLEVGRETQLQYNWETLEKQIIDRFIRGRPKVCFVEVEYFMFREDARGYYSFNALRCKIPQEPIQGHVRTQILSEFKDLTNVSDAILTLEIAIGFLSQAGGNPEMKISNYCREILLLDDGKARLKSKKAEQCCSLSNILDLWRTLVLGRAKLLFRNDQDPFDQVPDYFKVEMPKPIITRFSGALRKVDLEMFLSKVVEVINLKLAEEDKETGDMGLYEYLSMYFEENNEEFPYLDEIPKDARVEHMIYAWQLALERSEQDGRRRRSMMT